MECRPAEPSVRLHGRPVTSRTHVTTPWARHLVAVLVGIGLLTSSLDAQPDAVRLQGVRPLTPRLLELANRGYRESPTFRETLDELYSQGTSSSCGAPGLTSSNYDVTADGQRFLMIRDDDIEAETSRQIVLVQAWAAELSRAGLRG